MFVAKSWAGKVAIESPSGGELRGPADLREIHREQARQFPRPLRLALFF
jgi:hypothetical protein